MARTSQSFLHGVEGIFQDDRTPYHLQVHDWWSKDNNFSLVRLFYLKNFLVLKVLV